VAPINYICLSFIFGLFVSLVFVPSPSYSVILMILASTFLTCLVWGRGRPLPFAIVIFYLLGLARPSVAWDYQNVLTGISGVPVVESTRQAVKASLNKSLPEPHSSLAYGILFGVAKGQSFDRNFLLDLRRTGTAHMVAVSGYNVSIIVGIVLNTSVLLVSKAFLLPGILGLLLYDVVCGFSSSVMRATVMGLYLFAAGLFGRQKSMSDALLFSAALILALFPGALFDLGFELSFLAMMAVMYLSPLFEKLFKFLPGELNKVVSATLASQVLIMPVSVYSFGQLSIIAPLANVLTFITVTPIMALTALGVLAGFGPSFLANIISIPNFVLLDYFVKVVGTLSALPWSSVEIK